MEGAHPSRDVISVLSLLRPRTLFGASSLYLRFTFTPTIALVH
jgi:hypothetical protein